MSTLWENAGNGGRTMIPDETILEYAREAREKAYAWRSGFDVGAALVMKDGTVIKGGNVEVHGMVTSAHAEMMVFYQAVNDHGPEYVRENAHTIAVSCSDYGGHLPCHLCTHTISEFVDDIRILADNGPGEIPIETTLDQQYNGAYRPGDHD